MTTASPSKDKYDYIDEDFRFDEGGHKYEIYRDDKWQKLQGTTSVIGKVIAKPGLTWWASKKACQYLGWKHHKDHKKEERIESVTARLEEIKQMTPEEFLKELDNAYRAHNDFKEDSAEKGTNIHERIEGYVNTCIDENNGKPIKWNTDDEQLKNFEEWARSEDVTFIASEQRVYSEEHWFAGTFDLLLERGGKRLLGDIKTSSGIYPSYFIQMGAYNTAYEEYIGGEVDGSVVIRLSRDGSFGVQYSFNLDRDSQMFLNTLDLYRSLKEF